MRLFRIINEIFIFPAFCLADKKLKAKKQIKYENLPSEYKLLAKQHLIDRIREEQIRTEAIIEKTYKILTFSGAFFTIISFSSLKTANVWIQLILLYYAAGMIFWGINSLSTYQRYGYGTYFKFLAQKRTSKKIIAEDLFKMEIVSISKSNTNSVCFMCLRNIVITLVGYYGFIRVLSILEQYDIICLPSYISDFLC